MTLTELKTLIQNYVESSETTFVSTLDDVVKNAEERIFEEVQFDFFRKKCIWFYDSRIKIFNVPIRLCPFF